MDARRFHELTKNPPRSAVGPTMRSPRPHPFKDYVDLDPTALPEPADTGSDAHRSGPVELAEVAHVLRWGAGVQSEVDVGGTYFYFRTYSSAGALYPIEVYVAAGDITGLDAGVYHYHPLEHALRPIRPGDPRAAVADACGRHERASASAGSVILTAIPWRTMWKYGARGYRHVFWDAGTMLANVLALAARRGPEVTAGFVDGDVDALVGIGNDAELSVCVVPFGEGRPADEPPGPLDPRSRDVRPVARGARTYEEVVDAHTQSTLATGDAARSWRAQGARGERPAGRARAYGAVEDAIRARRSMRSYAADKISRESFESVLHTALAPVPADWASSLVRAYTLVYGVEEVSPGAYRLGDDGLECLREGSFRDDGAHLCLGQRAGGAGAATVFLMSDLDEIVSRLGNRGYRAAQLEAGIVAGRILLEAYASGLGATCLTFFDDAVREFFGTKDEPMLVVACGRPRRRR